MLAIHDGGFLYGGILQLLTFIWYSNGLHPYRLVCVKTISNYSLSRQCNLHVTRGGICPSGSGLDVKSRQWRQSQCRFNVYNLGSFRWHLVNHTIVTMLMKQSRRIEIIHIHIPGTIDSTKQLNKTVRIVYEKTADSRIMIMITMIIMIFMIIMRMIKVIVMVMTKGVQ